MKVDTYTYFSKVLSFFGDHPLISISYSFVSLGIAFLKSVSPLLSFVILLCASIVGILTAWDKIEKRIIKIKIKKKSRKVSKD